MFKTTVSAFLVALFATGAQAQINGEAFAGFGGGSKEPIAIEADQLEVVDGESRAVFTGNVLVRQGSSTIRTGRLEVFYTGQGAGTGGTQGDIERMSLSGGLTATTNENKAVADAGTYEVAGERVTLEGNVVLSQGPNVATGCKLVANLKTNRANLQSCGGRVRTVLTPGSTGN